MSEGRNTLQPRSHLRNSRNLKPRMSSMVGTSLKAQFEKFHQEQTQKFSDTSSQKDFLKSMVQSHSNDDSISKKPTSVKELLLMAAQGRTSQVSNSPPGSLGPSPVRMTEDDDDNRKGDDIQIDA